MFVINHPKKIMRSSRIRVDLLLLYDCNPTDNENNTTKAEKNLDERMDGIFSVCILLSIIKTICLIGMSQKLYRVVPFIVVRSAKALMNVVYAKEVR